ncbi:nectin-4 isoform X2 [Silurus asotus]|uniref:Nectin-4 isoform X2 n=1 Tax=Silurus asotus TaxID=30991 RepID=A0AAD5A599_SILAS|nr:nectin-4 isoform X2 [Silurus asotus]
MPQALTAFGEERVIASLHMKTSCATKYTNAALQKNNAATRKHMHKPLTSLVCVTGGTLVEPTSANVYTTAEEGVILPCKVLPSEGEVIVQVIWMHIKPDGSEEQIITAHHEDGQLEFPAYAGRVRFESSTPMIDSALRILNTGLSDEGNYVCTIVTFPSGSVKKQLSLTVWTKPISTLDPFVLVEGESFRVAATCRAMAKPQAGLSWDTDLPGQSQNRSLENGVTSIQYSLHPLRSMNGRRLDCLVWHPSLQSPLRIENKLEVQYPPDATISGYDENWYVGLEGAQLQCEAGGKPKPHNFTWTRKDGSLPDGVTVENEIMRFDRPLRLTDNGTYECVATNTVGSEKVHLKIEVTEEPKNPTSLNSLLLIITGAVAGLLVLILVIVVITVNRHHKRKNQQLALELNEKKEEISTLSRQASIRRVASTSIDNKYQMEELIPLRVEGTIRTSLSSLERPRSRDSHSTLGGVDSLGRPALYNTSRRGRERTMDREKDLERVPSRVKVDPYGRNSDASLVHPESHFHPPLQLSNFSVEQTAEIIRSRNGSAILPADGRPQSGGGSITSIRAGSRGHHSPLNLTYPMLPDDEDLRPVDEASEFSRGQIEPDGMDNGGSETASSQISEAMSNHFEHTNGTLWPKAKPNNILLSPETTRLHPVHSNMNHHVPQIV